LSEPKLEKCPQCGRQIYENRPSCLYCGWRRPISAEKKRELQRNLIGIEPVEEFKKDASSVIRATASPESPSACPKCGNPLKPGAKFCTGCGTKMETPSAQTAPSIASQQTTEWQESQPADGESKKKGVFTVYSSEKRPASETALLSIENIVWAIGILMFIATLVTPYGILPPMKSGIFTGLPQPVRFPLLLLIPYILIFTFMVFSIAGMSLPGGLNGKYFFPIFCLAALIFVLIIAAVSFRKGFFVPALVCLIVYLIVLKLILKKSKSFLNRLNDYEALILMISIFVIIFSAFLKMELLSETIKGIRGSLGAYFHYLACLLFAIGTCLKIPTKKKTSQKSQHESDF